MEWRKNYEKSFELISKAAEQGYPYAMFRVGLYMEKGVLGEVKPERGLLPGIQRQLKRTIMMRSLLWDVAIEKVSERKKTGIGALEWFSKGAEKNEARCLTELGMAYENGNGVEENPQKAVEYMMKAAEQDYGYAQFKMGRLLFLRLRSLSGR